MVSQAQRVPSPAAATAPPPPSSLLPQRRTQHQQRSNTTSSEHEINNTVNSNNNNTFSPSRNSSSSNNNLQMERVTFHLHSRLCNFGLTHTTSRTRNVLEHLLLILAICCACALLMLHRTFVAAPSCLDALEGFDPSRADLTHLVILPHNLTKSSELMEPKSTVLWSRKNQRRIQQQDTIKECSNDEDPATDSYYEEWLEDQLASNTLPISYSYSTTKAFLMLPYDHFWLQHNMDVQYVLVAPTDPVCFGEPVVQFFLWNCFVGGNTVLLNWLLTFPAYEQQDVTLQPKGYVYNPRTEWFWEFSGDRQATKKSSATNANEKLYKLLAKMGVFLRTSFLFFFCTTLVSFTLRETQERMLDFTRELSRRVRQSISLSDLITTHLVQNLVFVPIMLGMMFFLIEFYDGDKFLAFSISSIVWSVEGFSLVCLRSSQGLSYFPYFFFLLFLLFHVYQTAFQDHGFVYLALTVVWCFMLHSMIFFWHRYELPALVRGHVSIDRPRMNMQQQQQHEEHDSDESDYNSNVSMDRSDRHRATTIDASNTTSREQPRHSARTTSIDGSHLTTPLLTTATQTATSTVTTTATAPLSTGARNSSSSHLSANGGILSSRQSFLSTSTSSRRTSGLYRLNQEDDNSTGSHLYFMGGEVVVHERRNRSNSHGNRDLSPPTIRRGNSIESISETVEQLDAPISSFIRNESNFSLLSSASDTYGSTSNGINNNNSNVGLDVTDDVLCDTLPNDTSMETVDTSNVSTPQKQQRQRNDTAATADTAEDQATTDGYYAHESGGLQAIFESKLTPRHRNTTQRQQDSTTAQISSLLGNTTQQQQQSVSSASSSSTSELQYQRLPPTFPEFTHS